MKSKRAVLIRISRESGTPSETWRIEYQFAEPVRAFRFESQAVLAPHTRLVPEHHDMVVHTDGQGAICYHSSGDHFSHARFLVKIFPLAQAPSPEAGLGLSIPEEGGRIFFTGSLRVVPIGSPRPPTELLIVAPAGHSIVTTLGVTDGQVRFADPTPGGSCVYIGTSPESVSHAALNAGNPGETGSSGAASDWSA